MIFFISQGVLMCLETAFTRITGIKIRGWPGRTWAILATGIPASIMVEVSLSQITLPSFQLR